MLFIVVSVASFLLSWGSVIWIEKRWRQQLLDIPNDRSSHVRPTPRGGGLGFIVAMVSCSAIAAVSGAIDPSLVLRLWLVLLPLAIVGFIDDRGHVPARVRYLIQMTAAGLAVTCFGSFEQPWLANWSEFGQILAWGLTAIGFTAIVNFYNFMDGLDGLVAGVSAVQLAFIAAFLHQPLWWLWVAALGGFLLRNWSPAKIFMGDVGSTVLGASVAIALLETETVSQAWTSLAITAPILADAIYTLARRLLQGENIFQAHRTHLYQRLQQFGWSHPRVALTYIAIATVDGVAIALWGGWGSVASVWGVLLAIALGELYLYQKQGKCWN